MLDALNDLRLDATTSLLNKLTPSSHSVRYIVSEYTDHRNPLNPGSTKRRIAVQDLRNTEHHPLAFPELTHFQ